MEIEKIAIIVANITVGFIVFLMGLGMLSYPYNLIWVIFNLWLWVVTPLVILLIKSEKYTGKPYK